MNRRNAQDRGIWLRFMIGIATALRKSDRTRLTEMAGLSFFKKIVPIALAGAAALVMAIPMSASAGDWNRHEQIAHQAWLARHQNWLGGWHDFHAAAPAYGPSYAPRAYGYAPQAVIPAAPAYGAACGPTRPHMRQGPMERATDHAAISAAFRMCTAATVRPAIRSRPMTWPVRCGSPEIAAGEWAG